jgi:uncharacterized membrane protein YtjA (UPF0391 family)
MAPERLSEVRLLLHQHSTTTFSWEEAAMGFLKWAVIFMIVAGIAALFGFTGIAAGAADVARILFYIFLAICVLFFIVGAFTYRAVTK